MPRHRIPGAMLTQREAIAAIAMLAMDADGALGAEEDGALRDLLMDSDAFAGATQRELSDVLVAVERHHQKLGGGGLRQVACLDERGVTRAA